MKDDKKNTDETMKALKTSLIVAGIICVALAITSVVLEIRYSQEQAWKDAVVEKMCDYSGYSSAGCRGMRMLKSMDADAIKNMDIGKAYY